MFRLIGILVISLTLSACAAPTRPLPTRAHVGSSGDSWAAIRPSPRVAEALRPYGPEALPFYDRRDASLNITSSGDLALATEQWPRRPRPTLDRTRRIRIDERSRTSLFFLPERARRRH